MRCGEERMCRRCAERLPRLPRRRSGQRHPRPHRTRPHRTGAGLDAGDDVCDSGCVSSDVGDDARRDRSGSCRPAMSAESARIEGAIDQAIARGDFDDLPGAGKPLKLPERHDPDWWIKQRLEQVDVDRDALLPPVVLLRREHDRCDETLAELGDEQSVREYARDFTERVLADRSANPMARTLCPQLDPEEAVARWRELRAERARPEPQELDQAASRGGPGTSHGRRRWWRFGRRSQGPFRPLSGPPLCDPTGARSRAPCNSRTSSSTPPPPAAWAGSGNRPWAPGRSSTARKRGSRRGSTCRAAASSTCASSPSRTGRRNRSASTWTCSAARQLEVAQRLRELGASDLDIGQGEVPWIVLGDVEGNPFCVMEHREVYEDTGPIAAMPLDSADPDRDAE